MFVLIHVIIALSSVIYGTVLAISPSKRGLCTTYGLVAATLVSGTILTIVSHAQILRACLSGLIYVAAVLILVSVANRKLAVTKARISK